MAAQVQFKNLTLGYDRHPAVHHLNGVVEEGALLAVVGPNGAGKSTLFKGLVGAIKPLAGSIAFGAADGRAIAYLPQVVDIDRNFPLTVYDMIAMGLWRHVGVFGSLSGNLHGKIEDAIAAVGLTGFELRTIGSLSGGQFQRMLFARLLLQDARIIVLDEPFNAVDSKTVEDLLALIRRWHGEKRTVLAALHDIDLVRAHFPQTLLLAREPIAWGDTDAVLKPANLMKARQMCEAFDEEAQECVETRAA
ncbi:MAG TPA: ABC transporter ATP-binding protein [Pseudolabrys sp.]|nr:ABC transporter ATP-binding protein [Pseudolabrys sp.]